MYQTDRALFLYGFDVDNNSKYINFKNQAGGPVLTAVLNPGNYTGTGLLAELKRAMDLADGFYKYTWVMDRTILAGTSNRIRVTTTSTYLSILFGTGVSAPSSPRELIGFGYSDLTGATTYQGLSQAGTVLYPDFATWDYLGPDSFITNDGSKNVSASGVKETLVFAQMKFLQGQWKYITNLSGSTQLTQWQNFLKYSTRQLKFEFTPSVNEDPSVFYQVTLESTSSDSNGMGFKLNQQRGEMLYRFYDTGLLKMRVIPA